jgi:polysaccharide export outer membrane protein
MKNLLCLLSFALLLTGCQHPGPRFNPYQPPVGATKPTDSDLQMTTLPNRVDPTWLKPASRPFTLGPGDRIEVELVDDTNTLTTCNVGPDGKIYFGLLPGTDVWGLTLPQTKALLEKGLSEYYREQPRLSVILRGVESRRIWLLGRVQSPGVYYMTNSLTLLEAIAAAGGTMSLATQRDLSVANSIDEQTDLSHAFIVRRGKRLPIDFQRLVEEGDLSQNIYLEPDDFVYLPSMTSQDVYVIGAVGVPRVIPYLRGMTVAGAIASAGGTAPEAYLSHVALVRGSISQPRIAILDYKAIVTGNRPDPVLQPHDIVYVPLEPYRYLVRYGELIMNTFVSSVAINEGIRSVSGQAIQPAGVFIPVGSRITVTPSGVSQGPIVVP